MKDSQGTRHLPGPVDVAALAALPVLGREEALALLRQLLPDLHGFLLGSFAVSDALNG